MRLTGLEQLIRMQREDPEVAQLLMYFEEVDEIYHSTLRAMGAHPEVKTTTTNDLVFRLGFQEPLTFDPRK